MAQIINGILLPILLLCMVHIASDHHVMGHYTNGHLLTIATWFTIAVVIALTVAMFIFQVLGF
jgi:Mn2+/Fe2+ NRAMP family transporter